MPKSYEDEIRDLLKGMDRFPGENRRRRRWRMPSFEALRQLDARRLMGGALILMLFAWVLRGPWSGGFPMLTLAAGYISLASVVLFVLALVLLLRAGTFGGSFGGSFQQEQRWRGQKITLPARGGPFASFRRWLRHLSSRLSGGPARRRPDSRGRDSFQW